MKNFTKIVTVFLSMLLLGKLHAATITAANTGSWTATTTWVGGVVPTAADNVIIPSGKTVTYTLTVAAFVNPATISVSGTIVFEDALLTVRTLFQNAITITVESGGIFRDNTKEGGYDFNSKVSSFIFKTGSSFATGPNNTYGDVYVVAVSSANYTAGTVMSPTTPRPFTISGNGSATVLPLTIQSFVAYPQNTSVNLVWQTTNEVNVSHIYVERSTDGTSFTRINKLSAKGGGTYTYGDDVAALSSSKLYYRLMIVDKDGSASYSKVISAHLGSINKQLAVYPNPVKGNLFVQITSTKAEKITLQVADLQGKILQQEDTQVGVGNVSLSVNTSALAKGSYVLLVKGSGGVQQKQFVKE
jgi:hypothetical protein